MATTNLQLTDIDESQAQKATSSNARAEEIDAVLTAQTSVAVTTTNVTLTDAQHNKTAYFKFTGAMTGNRSVVCKNRKRVWVIEHACSGGFTITFKTAAGTGVDIVNGDKKIVYCDGTNVVLIASAPTTATITVQEVDGSPIVTGVTTIEFDQDDGFVVSDEGGGLVKVRKPTSSGITVKEVDGSPTVASVLTLSFDQTDGFSVTDLGGGAAKVKLTVSGAGLTVQEADGSPSYANVAILEVNQGDGLSLTEPTAGTARINFSGGGGGSGSMARNFLLLGA